MSEILSLIDIEATNFETTYGFRPSLIILGPNEYIALSESLEASKLVDKGATHMGPSKLFDMHIALTTTPCISCCSVFTKLSDAVRYSEELKKNE